MYDKDLKKTYGENPIFINKFPLGALGDMRSYNLRRFYVCPKFTWTRKWSRCQPGGAAKAEGIKYLNDLLDKRTKTPTAKVSDAIADDEFLSKVWLNAVRNWLAKGNAFRCHAQ